MSTSKNGVLKWNGEFSPNLRKELTGKLVIIAGGGDGIGAALADGYNALGAKVAILDVNTAGAEAQSQKLAAARPKAYVTKSYQADLTDESKAKEAVRSAVQDAGSAPYIFVSTIGFDKRAKFLETSSREILKQLEINAFAPINAAEAAYKELRAANTSDGGTFVLFTSGHSGRIRAPDMIGYSGGKRVLENWTELFAQQAGAENQKSAGHVRAFTLEPGWVQTPKQIQMLEATGANPQVVFEAAKRENLIPKDMLAQDLATSVIHLAAKPFFLLTNTKVVVNGGEGQVARTTAVDAGATSGGVEKVFTGGHMIVPEPAKPKRKRKAATAETPELVAK